MHGEGGYQAVVFNSGASASEGSVEGSCFISAARPDSAVQSGFPVDLYKKDSCKFPSPFGGPMEPGPSPSQHELYKLLLFKVMVNNK